jgi:hypothetical protein
MIDKKIISHGGVIMSELTLCFDGDTQKRIDDLRNYYHKDSNLKIIRLALALLEATSEVERQDGYLVAKINGTESRIRLK